MPNLIKCIPTQKDIAAAVAKVDWLPTGSSRNEIVVPWDVENCPIFKDSDQWHGEPGAKVKLVTIKKLFASQDFLDRKKLLWHLKNPGAAFEGKHIHPKVVKVDGKRVICDGHHRLAALLLLGVDDEAVWQLKA